ncbi:MULTISPECIES: alpha/beta fold hydrolase [unclassified Vibrio]|uniref:alpha/beta fold hydrolase n=1 Tax=unclassified Vibrio TaxID=2614977 RepID=UPI0025569AA5|nr:MULTISPECIES: alpha/beta hydrolase [unclassified Vibrio]MDK9777984.1 alpha/beta hydrolase [Vibrio sp. D401a]MDK9801509.1 alpha/beta hydrolase [Vibrio sp. D406a]
MNKNQTIQSGHYHLKIIVRGSGIPLVIIGSADYYLRVTPTALFDHFQCVFVDHRGFAECDVIPNATDATLEAISADIKLVMDKLGIEKAWMFGHSGHALMATHFAVKFPQYVEGLVLANISPNLSPQMQAFQFQRWEQETDKERKQVFERNFPLLARDIEQNPERKFVHLCHRLGAMRWYDPEFNELPLWEGFPTHTALLDELWGEVFAEFDTAIYQQLPTVQVLVISGEKDFSIAPVSSWDQIDFGEADMNLEIIAESAHTPMLEQPERFVKVMSELVATS